MVLHGIENTTIEKQLNRENNATEKREIAELKYHSNKNNQKLTSRQKLGKRRRKDTI